MGNNANKSVTWVLSGTHSIFESQIDYGINCCLVTESCRSLLLLRELEPIGLLCLRDFPGNTGVGCHFNLQLA